MKLIASYIILLVSIVSSCGNQEYSDTLNLHYLAQTRGFKYEIILKTNVLEIINNDSTNTINLSEIQTSKIDSLIDAINFETLKNNISTDELATDSAIKGVFDINYKSKSYNFEFNHHKLPSEIQKLFEQLESFIK
jgi:hypothetical protein